MKRQQLIHSGQSPYACDVCNKTFSQMSDMKILILYTMARVCVPVMCVMKHSITRVT